MDAVLIILMIIIMTFSVTFLTAPVGPRYRARYDARPQDTPNPMSTQYPADRSIADARAAVCRARAMPARSRLVIYTQAVSICARAGLTRTQTARTLGIGRLNVNLSTTIARSTDNIFHDTDPDEHDRITQNVTTAWL